MDATKVQKYVVGMIDLTDDEKFLYDTNGDNVLTVIDATNIQKIIVGSQFDTSEPSSLTETTSVYGTEASTETTISNFSSACAEVTTEYSETTAYTEATTECVEETTIVDEPSTESTETTTEEVTEPSTKEYTEQITEQITEQPTTEPKPTVPPKSVKFNKNTITLGVESYTLITTIENGDISQVAFTTSDRKVATVDNNGKITAVGTGTATITANTYNGLKTQCKVTVKKLANSIKLDKTSITLGIGEQYDFSSYVPSGTAAYYRSYYSDDPNIAFVQKAGGLMTAKGRNHNCEMQNAKRYTSNL